jgi:hypothetical protein
VRFRNHGCDPGSAHFGLTPTIAKRHGQFPPSGREQIACAPLFVQASMRRESRVRCRDAGCGSRPPFLEGLAHAAPRLDVRRRDCLRRTLSRISHNRVATALAIDLDEVEKRLHA